MDGHDRGITRVAFSPSGSYLATAGLDGRICVWEIESMQLLYSFDGDSPVLSLLWIPPTEDILVCGFHCGNVAVLKISPTALHVKEFWAHAFPVECLAIRPIDSQLASGAHRELFVWQWNESAGRFDMKKDISAALNLKKSRDDANDILITSIHWTSSSQHANLLLVTFMHHGLVLLETEKWSRIRTIPLHEQIAGASLSDDGQRLAISNVLRGFDVYSMRSGAPLCTIEHNNRGAYPIPVLFIHGDLALLAGSTTGELIIWDVVDTESGNATLNTPEGEDPQPRVMHVLPVPQQAKALAIAVGIHTSMSIESLY
ncbi:WD40 repeat-like protein [Trametes sanguinea]|nr:WD40 repeat-like protein [Trametes sanguinea]